MTFVLLAGAAIVVIDCAPSTTAPVPFDPTLIRAHPSDAGDGLTVDGIPRELLARLSQQSAGQRRRALRVYTEDADLEDPAFPAVSGTVAIGGHDITFVPRHPLVVDHAYRVRLDLAVVGGSPVDDRPDPTSPLRLVVRTSRTEPIEPPLVEAIYPSGDQLPANQLKLYIHFSQPMRRWDPYEHIRLVDAATGNEVDAAFHAMRDGLWDAEGRRLTVIFDPGRVKRGLANNLALGTPLTEGREYRLLVEDSWPAASGQRLGNRFEKSFRVAPADRQRPDPASWAIDPPFATSREGLVVRFPEPLDHALLQHRLAVRGPSGRAIAGRASSGEAERSWRFSPDAPWKSGVYELVVDPGVEDLAGNNIERLFDVDLERDEPARNTSDLGQPVLRPFRIREHIKPPGRGDS